MTRALLVALLALTCALGVGCKNGSGSNDDGAVGGSVDGGAGGRPCTGEGGCVGGICVP